MAHRSIGWAWRNGRRSVTSAERRVTVNRFWQQFFAEHRENLRRLRRPRRVADASRIARLAGDEFQTPTFRTAAEGIPGLKGQKGECRSLEHATHSATDRDVEHVPTIKCAPLSPQLSASASINASRKRAARSRSAIPLRRRSHPRCRAVHQRLAGRKSRGKSVKPYQPLACGSGRVRRSTTSNSNAMPARLFTAQHVHVLETDLAAPTMTTSTLRRGGCTVRRARTNTPCNRLRHDDEQFVEASRHFARRILTKEAQRIPTV